MDSDKIYYGVKVEHSNGEIFYFGKMGQPFCAFSKCSFTETFKNKELSNEDNVFYNFPLNWALIKSLGASSYQEAKKIAQSYGRNFIYKNEVLDSPSKCPKFSIVELNTYLFEIRLEKQSKKISFWDSCPNFEITNEDEFIIKDDNTKIVKFDDFRKNRK